MAVRTVSLSCCGELPARADAADGSGPVAIQRLGSGTRDTAQRRLYRTVELAGLPGWESLLPGVAGPHRASRRRRHRAARGPLLHQQRARWGGCLRRRFWVSCGALGIGKTTATGRWT